MLRPPKRLHRAVVRSRACTLAKKLRTRRGGEGMLSAVNAAKPDIQINLADLMAFAFGIRLADDTFGWEAKVEPAALSDHINQHHHM